MAQSHKFKSESRVQRILDLIDATLADVDTSTELRFAGEQNRPINARSIA